MATFFNECLEHGADVIVNTDGDNQIPAEISQAYPTDFGRRGGDRDHRSTTRRLAYVFLSKEAEEV